ncbi:MAG: hypothetical protein LW832_05395 [Parachlamydia sp.]|nr:hypothetical protein [Parachlamydia sp.]
MPRNALTYPENVSLTAHCTQKLADFYHSDYSITGTVASRVAGIAILPFTSLADACINAGKGGLTCVIGALCVSPNNFIAAAFNPAWKIERPLDISSGLINIMYAVECVFNAALLPCLVFFDPEKANQWAQVRAHGLKKYKNAAEVATLELQKTSLQAANKRLEQDNQHKDCEIENLRRELQDQRDHHVEDLTSNGETEAGKLLKLYESARRNLISKECELLGLKESILQHDSQLRIFESEINEAGEAKHSYLNQIRILKEEIGELKALNKDLEKKLKSKSSSGVTTPGQEDDLIQDLDMSGFFCENPSGETVEQALLSKTNETSEDEAQKEDAVNKEFSQLDLPPPPNLNMTAPTPGLSFFEELLNFRKKNLKKSTVSPANKTPTYIAQLEDSLNKINDLDNQASMVIIKGCKKHVGKLPKNKLTEEDQAFSDNASLEEIQAFYRRIGNAIDRYNDLKEGYGEDEVVEEDFFGSTIFVVGGKFDENTDEEVIAYLKFVKVYLEYMFQGKLKPTSSQITLSSNSNVELKEVSDFKESLIEEISFIDETNFNLLDNLHNQKITQAFSNVNNMLADQAFKNINEFSEIREKLKEEISGLQSEEFENPNYERAIIIVRSINSALISLS